MPGCTLCLAFHCHQPVGNFDHVVADAFQRCYHPMLEVFAEHPHVRFGLHWSGILYEWAEAHEPDTLALLRRLVGRGQVELLGGGFYEPLLPLLPPNDVAGQLRAMQDYLQAHFGQTPTGFWLTERVWEPQLPRLCAPAGLRYTLTDDTHFRAAGLDPDALVGYFLTEDGGHSLGVFPVDKALRYAIPFREPAESIARLRNVADRIPGAAVTYGDDGEKFGLWPGTYEWVYTKRYLHRFCEALEAEADWLAVRPPGEWMADMPPTGRVYLPTASYDEMETWALGAEDQLTFDRLMHADLPAVERRFLRGGFFRNFLVKYPEANLLHKRMVHTSARVAATPEAVRGPAERELWQGQCSCAYWHGLFGGLYLNGIRQAAHSHCIQAAALADGCGRPEAPWVEADVTDLDCDGALEVGIRGSAMEFWVHPDDGGTVSILDDRRTGRMLTDVLTRRPEAYHAAVAAAADAGDGDETQPQSIHDQARAKESGLGELLHYDVHTRRTFRDRALAPGDTLQDAVAGRLHDAHGWEAAAYEHTLDVRAHTAELVLDAHDADVPLRKIMRYDDAGAALGVRYALPNGSGERVRFATELQFTLLAADAPDRRVDVEAAAGQTSSGLGETAESSGVSAFELVDEWARSTVRVACSPPATLWRYPVETVSSSESGYERTYQGTAFLFVWEWDPAAIDGPAVNVSLHPHA